MSTETDIAWAAGLFEGEGCICSHERGQQVVVKMAMTDEDVIRRFHRIVGCGKLADVPKRQPHHKAGWAFAVYGDDAERLLETFMPFLGERRMAKASKIVSARKAYYAAKTAPRSCEHCGREFTPKFYRGQEPKFCTHKCANAAGHLRRYRPSRMIITQVVH